MRCFIFKLIEINLLKIIYILLHSKPKRNVVSHIFNGKVFSGNIIYQLCDLSDSKLKKMVNTKKGLLKEFNVNILLIVLYIYMYMYICLYIFLFF